MAEPKKVRVCKKCSGFDVALLKGKVKVKDYSTGCIGLCKQHEGKVFGYLNGELTVCDNADEFLAKVAEVVG